MTTIDRLYRGGRRAAGTSLEFVNRTLGSVGFADSADKLHQDAQEYWRNESRGHWKADSHWRDADIFQGNDLWSEVGRRHLALFDRLARVTPGPNADPVIVEWGCGGGANAVVFAPRASEFVGVDISSASLDECARQVATQSSTPFRSVLVDVDAPESAVECLDRGCDVFLCFYVFELITSQEYGARLLRIAHRMLAEGGLALIQVRYDTGSFMTRTRRRSYRKRPANMTTFRIDGFWALAQQCGFQPEVVHLVPENEIDERYAYFLLSKTPH